MNIQKLDAKGKIINITVDEFPEHIRVHKGSYTAVYTNTVEEGNIEEEISKCKCVECRNGDADVIKLHLLLDHKNSK